MVCCIVHEYKHVKQWGIEVLERAIAELIIEVLSLQHLADPINTSIFSKAVIAPGVMSQPACQIPPVTNFQVNMDTCTIDSISSMLLEGQD